MKKTTTAPHSSVSSKKRTYVPGSCQLQVKRSTAGLGLFAGEAIPKGVCLIEYVGRVITKEEEYGTERTNTARYINHSCRPNCEVEIHAGRVFVFSKRAIAAGEELGYDYGKAFFDEHIKPKGCKCVKHRV
jgi:SET domain-containing protein